MSVLIWLVPIALLMGAAGLAAFFWSLRNGQYEDMAGAAERVLLDDDDRPIVSPSADARRGPLKPSGPTRRTDA